MAISERARREVAAVSSSDTARPQKWRQRPEAHSLALGGSRVKEDSLSPICVAVNSSTVKDLRWNSEGHLAPH